MQAMRYQLILFAAVISCAPAVWGIGEVEFITGFEGAVREPDNNEDQAWAGVEYYWDQLLWETFRPYARAMIGFDDSHYLVTMGLSFEITPLAGFDELRLGIQTGPAYTDVGRPHTGGMWNWTTDFYLRYKYFQLGYSHTSNGGIDAPNSGLDMVSAGLAFPLGKQQP